MFFKNLTAKFILFAGLIAASLSFSACDMTFIDGFNYNGGTAPCLTIYNLPRNTVKRNFSGIFLYNTAGVVAKCANYNEIVITADPVSATAKIPLVYSSSPDGSDFFRDSGTFLVTFNAHIDIYSQIIKDHSSKLTVVCSGGSGSVDLADDFGYFKGGLANPYDTGLPVIKSGTLFEINGAYFNVAGDTPVSNPEIFSKTTFAYVYASPNVGGIDFEFSTEAPSYDYYKKAFYIGDKRALYKFIFIKDSSDKYFAKTFITDSFTRFDYIAAETSWLASRDLSSVFYSLSGSGNPAAQTVTLQPGGYLFVLSGAAGGGGANGGGGGQGGDIAEVFIATEETSVIIFTGQAGGGGSGNSGRAGGGGGGGGSGSFIYSADGYFLCAGGGGGGGGSIGPGAGGGGGASSTGGTGGSGGSGGGYGAGGGGGGGSGYNGRGAYGGNSTAASGVFSFSPTYSSRATSPGDGGFGGYSAYFSLAAPNNWLNTASVNGSGGGGNGGGGGAGGNNRNSNRGGGGGAPQGQGRDGSVVIYKLF